MSSIEVNNANSSDDEVREEKIERKIKKKRKIDGETKYQANFKSPLGNKKRKSKYDPEEEARLERIVFGDAADIVNNLLKDEEKEVEGYDNFSHISTAESFKDEQDDDSSDGEYPEGDIEKDDAWSDSDDDTVTLNQALKVQKRKLPPGRSEKTYSDYLRNKFVSIYGKPKWAEDKIKDEDDSDSEILTHSSHLKASRSKKLPKNDIDLKVLNNINKETENEGPVVTSVEFHPTSTAALVAGQSGVLSIFQVDGKENKKLHSMKFENYSISDSHFLKEGMEIFSCSRNRPFCHSYDLLTGKTVKVPLPHGIPYITKFEVSPDGKLIAASAKFGEILLLSALTKELIAKLKMHSTCRAMTFTPDSRGLVTHGDSEEIYLWDVNSRVCINRAIDDGCLQGSSIAISPSNQFLASGSKQGVVNVYKADDVYSQKVPQPIKYFTNLVTPITSLKFNPTSEILAMASNDKSNAFKLVHLASLSVFANFPTFQTKMHNPFAIDFSPGSGFLGVTNNSNNAYLYRLKHYGNY